MKKTVKKKVVKKKVINRVVKLYDGLFPFGRNEIKDAIEKGAERMSAKGLSPRISSIKPSDKIGVNINGNFLILVVVRGIFISSGVSKFNPNDNFNLEAGLAIACRRLLE